VIVTNHGLGHGLTVISTFPMMKVLALVWYADQANAASRGATGFSRKATKEAGPVLREFEW